MSEVVTGQNTEDGIPDTMQKERLERKEGEIQIVFLTCVREIRLLFALFELLV